MEILIPYLNNPFEEAIFGSNKIKEEHETMALQNEEVCSKTLKSLINKLNRPVNYMRNFTEKAICIIYS